MATLRSVKEFSDGARSGRGITTIKASRLFHVEYDVPSSANVINATNANDGILEIPRFGRSHPDDSRLVVSNIQVVKVEAQRVIDVEVTYSATWVATDGGAGDGEFIVLPWQRPASITFGNIRFTDNIEQDQNGDPIHNSSGEPIDPPLAMDVVEPLLTITQNEQNFDVDTFRDFANRINSTTWTVTPGFVIDPLEAKCDGITGELKSEPGYRFWLVTYQFHIKFPETDNNGWEVLVVNEGYRELNLNAVTAELEPEVIKDKNKDPLQRPTRLQKMPNGESRAVPGTVLTPTVANGHALKFDIYPQAEFNDLPLRL